MSDKYEAAGTVVFNASGLVLLRRPTGGFGGYAWTFAKGKLDAGEAPIDAAHRETVEETGYRVEIIDPLGTWEGDVSRTTFFLAGSPMKVQEPGGETEALRWCTYEEAFALVRETTSRVGRERDMRVLEAAFAAWRWMQRAQA